MQRLICREINHSDGVFNKMLPNESSDLTNEQKLRTTFLLNSLKYTENIKKIPKIVSPVAAFHVVIRIRKVVVFG